MKLISKVRFDALASYCRDPLASVLAIELVWLATADERVLATLMVDTDGEFSAVVLAPDLKERYRWVAGTGYFSTPEEAIADLQLKVDDLLPRLDDERSQGDEVGSAVDFFTPVHPTERLTPDFVTLTSKEGYSPARGIVEPMMRWYEDATATSSSSFRRPDTTRGSGSCTSSPRSGKRATSSTGRSQRPTSSPEDWRVSSALRQRLSSRRPTAAGPYPSSDMGEPSPQVVPGPDRAGLGDDLDHGSRTLALVGAASNGQLG